MAEVTSTRVDVEALQDLVTQKAAEHDLVGVALGVVIGGQVAARVVHGPADVATGAPVTPSTAFRIASVTKTMTALSVLHLAAQGRLDLDAPLSDRLSTCRIEPPSGSRPVTPRDLLLHVSGIGELGHLHHLLYALPFLRKRKWEGQSSSHVLGPVLRTRVRPGTKWCYANFGYGLLGDLVAEVTGMPYREALEKTFFDPLCMTSTSLWHSDRNEAQLATGYVLKAGQPVATPFQGWPFEGAGGVVSTLDDMLRWAALLATPQLPTHVDVVPAAAVAQLVEPVYSLGGAVPHMGLGMMTDVRDGHRLAGHGGNIPGWSSQLTLAVDDGVAVVVLCNVDSGGTDALAREALDLVLGIDAEARPSLPVPSALRQELVGIYKPAPGLLTNFRLLSFGGQFEVAEADDRLVVRGAFGDRAGTDLQLAGPLVLTGEAHGYAITATFLRSPSGTVDRLILQPLDVVLHRVPRWRSTRIWTGAAALGTARRLLRRRQGDSS